MATTTSAAGERREIVERYVSVLIPLPRRTDVQVLAMIRDDDAEEAARLRAAGWRWTERGYLLEQPENAVAATLADLLTRDYSVPAPALVSGSDRAVLRAAYSTALGHKATSADFVFPNPFFS